jgi:chromate transporter
MKKNIMLFLWFLRFGLIPSDEYSIHDQIKERFCPNYMQAEDFDRKEQLLRDTPGPAGIKYAFYVGGKVNGPIGAVIAILGLLIPVFAIAVGVIFAYGPFMNIQMLKNSKGENIMFNGMYASALGLVIAHLYKIIYFNTVNRKSLVIIFPAALVFIFVNAVLRDRAVEIELTPIYIAAVIVFGVLFGAIHVASARYREKHPKYIDPYSSKAKKQRDREIREEEERMRGYRDGDTAKRRREQLEEEQKASTKHKGEE